MDDFYDVVRKRRMVRNYQNHPVDPDTLERILDAARRAPSAGFSQGQAMIVVTEEAGRRAVADLAGEDEYVAAGNTVESLTQSKVVGQQMTDKCDMGNKGEGK